MSAASMQAADQMASKKQRVEQQTAVIKKNLARAEKRVQEVTDKALALDTEIEERVDEVLKLITSIHDSTDSKTRITGVKKETIGKLAKSIKVYKQRRALLVSGGAAGADLTRRRVSDDSIEATPGIFVSFPVRNAS